MATLWGDNRGFPFQGSVTSLEKVKADTLLNGWIMLWANKEPPEPFSEALLANLSGEAVLPMSCMPPVYQLLSKTGKLSTSAMSEADKENVLLFFHFSRHFLGWCLSDTRYQWSPVVIPDKKSSGCSLALLMGPFDPFDASKGDSLFHRVSFQRMLETYGKYIHLFMGPSNKSPNPPPNIVSPPTMTATKLMNWAKHCRIPSQEVKALSYSAVNTATKIRGKAQQEKSVLVELNFYLDYGEGLHLPSADGETIKHLEEVAANQHYSELISTLKKCQSTLGRELSTNKVDQKRERIRKQLKEQFGKTRAPLHDVAQSHQQNAMTYEANQLSITNFLLRKK